MKTIAVRVKIKDHCIHAVRQWFQTLRDRKHEVLATLENEGVIVESVFLDRHGEDMFLIYYMKAKDLEKAHDAYSKSTFAIDNYHKENWKKYLEGRVVLEELLDIDNF